MIPRSVDHDRTQFSAGVVDPERFAAFRQRRFYVTGHTLVPDGRLRSV